MNAKLCTVPSHKSAYGTSRHTLLCKVMANETDVRYVAPLMRIKNYEMNLDAGRFERFTTAPLDHSFQHQKHFGGVLGFRTTTQETLLDYMENVVGLIQGYTAGKWNVSMDFDSVNDIKITWSFELQKDAVALKLILGNGNE